jgi:hypothetical protein
MEICLFSIKKYIDTLFIEHGWKEKNGCKEKNDLIEENLNTTIITYVNGNSSIRKQYPFNEISIAYKRAFNEEYLIEIIIPILTNNNFYKKVFLINKNSVNKNSVMAVYQYIINHINNLNKKTI